MPFLKEEKFPSYLKKATITPLFKKSDRTHPENYRPISIISSLSKMFQRLLRDQIVEFLLKNNFHSRMQFGFRSIISTMDALVYSTENFRYLIELVTTALLDLFKTFDSINHNVLILKLKKSGFSTSAQMLILDYLCICKYESIKYLRVSIDSAITYQDEVKNILRKMACGIKTYIPYER